MKLIIVTTFFLFNVLSLPAVQNCLDFDGSQSEVTVDNDTGLNPGSNGLTVEAWIKTSAESGNNWPGIINKLDHPYNGYQLFITKSEYSNKIAFEVWIDGNWYGIWGQTINDGKWHHVAGKRSGNRVFLYTDGVQSGGWVQAGANGYLSSYADLTIATDTDFIGDIDEVRVWNRALPTPEIQDNMFKEPGGTEPNLQAYYQFNQTSGHYLPDHSPNNNYGTLHWAMDDGDWVTSYAPIATEITENLTNVRGVWSARTSFASSIMTIFDPDISGNDRLIYGHNANTLAFESSNVPAGIQSRLSRVWRIEEYSDLTGDIIFDCSELGTRNENYRLLIDDDGDFSDALIVEGAYSDADSAFTVTNHNFEHSYYYTLGVRDDFETGLLAYYPFNGNASDESGNGLHGYVNYASLTTDRFNVPNSAYYFDGTNDWIRISDTPQLIVSDVTISAWVRWDGAEYNDNNHAIISNYSGSGSQYEHFGLRLAGDIVDQNGYTQFFYDDGSNWDVVFGTSSIHDGSWHLITTVITSGVSAEVYVDGELENIDTTGIPGSINPSNDTYIGRDGFAESQMRWFGKIDEVRIYNRALSVQEIFLLFHNEWLNSPQGVTINLMGNSVELNWQPVVGATSYKVYSSDDPFTGFEEDTSGTFADESWSAPLPNGKMFYNIKAVN